MTEGSPRRLYVIIMAISPGDLFVIFPYDDLTAYEAAARTAEMKRLTDDGALIIAEIKTYLIEEKEIIPLKA